MNKNIWNPPDGKQTDPHPLYICISGNSGAGKSSLLDTFADKVRLHKEKVIQIDEKEIHHPFIDRLFHAPARFGFEIQMNFMLQRVLVVKRWLDAGYSVIMERSHYDDLIFAKHLKMQKLINNFEYDSYAKLWHAMKIRCNKPDAIIFLSVPPDVSIARITADEDSGVRPREFRDEEHKRDWITSWYQRYEEHFTELASDQSLKGILLRSDTTSSKSAADLLMHLFNQ